jgi:hypothetical protein
MNDKEKKKYIEEVFKYCKTDSILVINKTGQLQRLQCPFEVMVILDVGELYKGLILEKPDNLTTFGRSKLTTSKLLIF